MPTGLSHLSLPMDVFFGSDEFLVMFVPVVVYWVYSGIYETLGSFDNYRLHSKTEEEAENMVSKFDVVKGVLFQQVIQVATSFLVFQVGALSFLLTFFFMNP